MQEKVGPKHNMESPSGQTARDGLLEGNRLYREHLNPTVQSNCLKGALNEYSRALEQEPDQIVVLLQVAKVLYRQGQYAKAEGYAKKALRQLIDTRQERSAVQLA